MPAEPETVAVETTPEALLETVPKPPLPPVADTLVPKLPLLLAFQKAHHERCQGVRQKAVSQYCGYHLAPSPGSLEVCT